MKTTMRNEDLFVDGFLNFFEMPYIVKIVYGISKPKRGFAKCMALILAQSCCPYIHCVNVQ